jgi:hypothetical protein
MEASMAPQAPASTRCPGPGPVHSKAPGALFCGDCYNRLPRPWRDQLQAIQRQGGPDRRRQVLRLRAMGIAHLAQQRLTV